MSLCISLFFNVDTGNGTEWFGVYNANITHNLTEMASEVKCCGPLSLYEWIWRPEENRITRAGQLITPLSEGLLELKKNRSKYSKYNPENGWGDYDNLVQFVQHYSDACIKYPKAEIGVCK